MKKLQVTFLSAVCVIILAASCNLDNDNPNPQQGAFLLANISPDAPPLSLSINGSGFGSGLKYGIYTPYYPATAGSYQFAVYGTSQTPVLTSTVNIEASKTYSYFIVDSFSRLKASFVEDNVVKPGPDSVYIRFFNFSPDAGPLSLFNVDSNKTWYSARSFNDVSANSFKGIKSGNYTLQLKYADSTIAATKIDTLTKGHVYSIFAKGLKNGTGADSLSFGMIIHL